MIFANCTFFWNKVKGSDSKITFTCICKWISHFFLLQQGWIFDIQVQRNNRREIKLYTSGIILDLISSIVRIGLRHNCKCLGFRLMCRCSHCAADHMSNSSDLMSRLYVAIWLESERYSFFHSMTWPSRTIPLQAIPSNLKVCLSRRLVGVDFNGENLRLGLWLHYRKLAVHPRRAITGLHMLPKVQLHVQPVESHSSFCLAAEIPTDESLGTVIYVAV